MNLKQKKTIELIIFSSLLIFGKAYAKKYTYPAIYPFVPMDKDIIYKDVARVSENSNFEKNFFNIVNNGYSKAKTKEKPWTSTYWPMSKGIIADPYEKSKIDYYVDLDWVDWDSNYEKHKERLKGPLKDISKLTQAELNKLAPSEKYDILLGDTTFDLTRRVWDYIYRWGKKKEHGFMFDDPNNPSAEQIFVINKDAIDRAKFILNDPNQNWDSIEKIFRQHWGFKNSLAVKKSLELLDNEDYDSIENAFPDALNSVLNLESNYVLAKKNSRLAAWEGICNGWSTAAGNIPRPRKPVSFDLPSGKKLTFYPEDIKGLVSMFWVNSLIQNNYAKKLDKNKKPLPSGEFFGGTISAGARCNMKAKTDIWGRKYDHKPDPFYGDRTPRCVGVHPAKWHLGVVDIIGRQQRSFIVERKVGPAVDNHPMYSYKMKYFNPNTGRSKKNINKNIEPIDDKDQFKQFRHKDARYIVGVEMVMTYMDYVKPRRQQTDSESKDEEVDKKMYYDLELDQNYDIVGGQWRTLKVGAPRPGRQNNSRNQRLNHNQPDFFWNVTKDWNDPTKTNLFVETKMKDKWTDLTKLPPASWKNQAIGDNEAQHSPNNKINGSHEFLNYMIWGLRDSHGNWVSTSTGTQCDMVNKKTGKIEKFPCNRVENKPQPLLNVINKLVDLSK